MRFLALMPVVASIGEIVSPIADGGYYRTQQMYLSDRDTDAGIYEDRIPANSDGIETIARWVGENAA